MKPRSYLSDYLIAFVVIVSAVALLVGLALALTGYQWQKPGRTLLVDFPDVAGIHRHSQVRYAGAPAGAVVGLRHLSTEERLKNANPRNAVRVTLSLHDGVPPIPDDVTAVLGSDTLLSEKFIALDAGTAGDPMLAEGAVIQGQPSPTFDDVMRGGGALVHVLDDLLPAVKKDLTDILPKIAALTVSGKDVADDARSLIEKANKLIADNQTDLRTSIKELPAVLEELDTLLKRAKGLVSTNPQDVAATIRDLHVVMQNMKVISTYGKTIFASLAGGRPTHLIWTNNTNYVPTEAEILKARAPLSAPSSRGAGGTAAPKVPRKP